jgi:hypothetical protein
MPGHHCSRGDHYERLFPFRPESEQSDPEEFVHGRQLATRTFPLQSWQLFAKRQIFENEILTGAEEAK